MADSNLEELQQIAPTLGQKAGRGFGTVAMAFNNWTSLSVIAIVMIWPITRHLFAGLPSFARYAPDAVIGLVTVVLIFRIIVTRGWTLIPGRYIAIFIGFVYVAVAGIVLNGVSGDTMFAGVRLYFVYVPIFLIPFAYNFGERDHRFQLGFVTAILLLQVPASVWERFVLYRHLFTGDYITGTLSSSASLALIGAGGVVYVVAMVVAGRLRISIAVLLSILFLLPPSLAETKITPIALCFGLAGVLFAMRKFVGSGKLIGVGGVAGVLLFGFVAIYDQLYSREDGTGYMELMTDSDRMLDNYNMRGVKALPFSIPIRESGYLIAKNTPKLSEEVPQLGRVDSISMPFYALYPDEFVYLMLGLGIANMDSNFGSGGDYQIIEEIYHGGHVTISHMLWEIGVLGTLFFVGFISMLLFDCYRISQRTSGYLQAMAAAQAGLSAIALLCLVYANLLHLRELLLVYLYLSAVVLANASRVRSTEPKREFRLVV